jgi:hypothetical protein
MPSWQYFEPIATLFKKGLQYVSPLATVNVNNAMHYFCGNTVPLLPPFWTNVAKHPLLQPNLWRYKWRQVAIGSKSSSVLYLK